MARSKLTGYCVALISLASIITVLSTLITSTTLTQTIVAAFNPSTHPFRFTALIVALVLNAKTLPLVWHVRLFRQMIYHLYLHSTRLEDRSQTPISGSHGALFKPMVLSGLYTPLMELDFNGHRSNSTYFSDADQARTMHVSALLRKGLGEAAEHDRRMALEARTGTASRTTDGQSGEVKSWQVKGQYMVVLGAVSCHFKREIAPYERYDIWTRVLSWDRKWIYVVSHFVKAGTVQPTDWTLQPFKKKQHRSRSAQSDARRRGSGEKGVESAQDAEESWKKAVFATSVARYVVKKGRLTIAPEECFMRSALLPPKPSGPETLTRRDSGHGEDKDDLSAWTWENVELKRREGLLYAQKLADLEELHEVWPVDPKGAPGVRMLAEDGQRAVEVIGEFADMW